MISTLIRRPGLREALLCTGALLAAVGLGASIAYAPTVLGASGPYVIVGGVAVASVALAIFLRWRLGAFLLGASLPFESLITFGSTASGIKLLALLTFLSVGVALLWEKGLYARLVVLLRQPLTMFALAFCVWVSLSLLWAYEESATMVRIVTFLGLFGFMIVVGLLDEKSLLRLWAITTISAAASVPAAYVLPEHEKVDMAGRFSSGGMDPNDYACFLVVIFFVAYFGLRRRYAMIVYASAPFLFFGIFASQSRTALLALIATPVLAVVIPRLTTRIAGRALLAYGLAAFVFAGIVLTVPSIGEALSERYATLEQYESEDTWAGRWSLWKGAFEIVADHPVTGVGAGNFPYVAPSYSLQAAHLESVGGEGSGVAHNILLSVTSELGFVGLVLFLGMLLFAVKGALSLVGRGPALAAGLVLGFVAFGIAGMALTWETHKVGYLIYGSILALGLRPTTRRGSGIGREGMYR